jgi:predicted phage terminase large subunit-like protein
MEHIEENNLLDNDPVKELLNDLGLGEHSVDGFLNRVDYDFPGYVPSTQSIKFIEFIKLVNMDKGGEENLTPVVHYKMLDSIFVGKNKRTAIMCHRGIGKTTLMAEYLILYIALFGKLDGFGDISLILYVSDSIENGVKNLRKNLQHRYENSEFLKKNLPVAKFTDVRCEFHNLDGHKLVYKGYGAKALSLDSILFTDNGFTTIEKCKVGDKIFGADGKLATITKKSFVFEKPMYKIVLEDNRELKVSEDHINSIVHKENVNNKARYVKKDLYTSELIKLDLIKSRKRLTKEKIEYVSNENLVFVENCKPLEYSEKKFDLDPYVLGLLLGDGSIKSDGSNILHAHIDDMSEYKAKIKYELGKSYIDKRNNTVESISIKGISNYTRSLKLSGIHGNDKFIPSEYLFGSIEQRLELLKGLLDTDGSIQSNGRIDFCSNSELLVDGVSSLVRSLGGTTKKRIYKKAYRIEIWIGMNPFYLKRKSDRFIKNKTKNLVAIKSIEPIKLEKSQCIAIDNDEHQFIANDYFRTHNTGVRGAKEMGVRPQLAILDDLISDEDARSKTVISSVKDTVYKAVSKALHPKQQKTIWLGTPFNQNDPLYEAVESGAWDTSVYPICERFDSTTTKADFKGSWSDRFNYEYVKDEYETAKLTGTLDGFNQELMLRIMSQDNRLVSDDDLQEYSKKIIPKAIGEMNVYITTDFATKDTQSSDYTVISVWGHTSSGEWLYLDGICRTQLMDKTFDDLFRFVSMYSPMSVGIEASGQQYGFITLLHKEMAYRKNWFTIAKGLGSSTEGITPKRDKLSRFMTVLPDIKAKKFYFPMEIRNTPLWSEIYNELSNVSSSGFKSKHDDFIDTMSMLYDMPTIKPTNYNNSSIFYNQETGQLEERFSLEEEEKNSYIF